MTWQVSVVFGLMVIIGAQGYCPTGYLGPCSCKDDSISCEGENITEYVLEKVFLELSQNLNQSERHFLAITISGTNLTQIKANVFKAICFDEITIIANYKLTKIDSNAFIGTEFQTETLNFLMNSNVNQSAQHIFNIVSRFVNLQKLHIDYNGFNITEIPDNAFKPLNGYQNKLKSIQIMRTPITKIGTRAFYFLNNLESLGFFRTDLVNISDFAFEFELNSTKTLALDINWSYKLKPTSFATNSLRSIRRPTNITMKYQSIYGFPYLDKSVFLPFVLDDDKNYLDHFQIKLNCTDCRNAWLKKYSNVIKKNFDWICDWIPDPTIVFNDPKTLANCTD